MLVLQCSPTSRFLCRFAILAAATLSLASCQRTADERADLIIVNARVFAPGSPFAEAIAVQGNRIVKVGARRDVEELADGQTRRLDAGGATVTPGFNDAHVHFLSGALSLSQVNLLDAQTLPEIQHLIAEFANAHPQSAWVQGRGWLYGSFPGGMPTRQQLDALVPDRPAAMRCYDGHTLWVNSKALALAGISRDTPDPPAGVIVRDVRGEPTGALKESAQELVDRVIPQPNRRDELAALKAGIAEALALGVTSIQEAGADAEMLDLLEELRARGELKLRAYLALTAHPRMTEAEADGLDELKRKYPDLDVGAVKMFADGVIEAHTAAMLEPYANVDSRGLPEYEADDMNRGVAMLDRRGWQIMIHAIGDAGIRMSLDALERTAAQNAAPARGRRHRLEHIEDVSATDIPRFGQLGVIASMQPFHANPNGNLLDVWAANVGPERAARAWSWKSIQDAGGRLAFGTDWPVVGIDPRPGIHTALMRQTADGLPPDGFFPMQRLPLEDVLRAYTEGSAYAQFAETAKGRIAAGMLADLVIWDRDLFALRPHEVRAARIAATIFDGQVAYEAP
jgi:predicted amidohydrolase YtcJ